MPLLRFIHFALTIVSAAFHSTGGPLTVEAQQWVTNSGHAFLAAGVELGYKVVDPNAGQQEGKFNANTVKQIYTVH